MLLALDQSELYTTDVRNIEYILKTNFDNYTKGEHNKDIITDLFGHGIFAVGGVKWKQQRKLASFEFSTRVLRDFSCLVFRTNAAKLVGIVSEFAKSNEVFDVQLSSRGTSHLFAIYTSGVRLVYHLSPTSACGRSDYAFNDLCGWSKDCIRIC